MIDLMVWGSGEEGTTFKGSAMGRAGARLRDDQVLDERDSLRRAPSLTFGLV